MSGTLDNSSLSNGKKSKCEDAPNNSKMDSNTRIEKHKPTPSPTKQNQGIIESITKSGSIPKKMQARDCESSLNYQKEKPCKTLIKKGANSLKATELQNGGLNGPETSFLKHNHLEETSTCSSKQSSPKQNHRKHLAVPKLNIISEADGRTAWIQSGLMENGSAMSQFIEDPYSFPLEFCNPDSLGNDFKTFTTDDGSSVNPASSYNIKSESSRGSSEKSRSKNNTSLDENSSKHEKISNESKSGHTINSKSSSKVSNQFEVALNDKVIHRAINIESGISSGVYNEYTEDFDEVSASESDLHHLPKLEISKERNCSQNTKMRFPSKSGGWWIPHFKPLAEFLDCKFEQKTYKFDEREMEFVKKVDYLLSCKFAYRGFNIMMVTFMGLDVILICTVSSLFLADELPVSIELIHVLFFDMVALFVLFALNSCASREVRVHGEYAVISYIRIYWHLIKRSFDTKFKQDYLFIDDWYGDDKYKFIKKKLYGNSGFELMSDTDMDDGSSYV